METRAVVFKNPLEVDLETINVPEPKEGEVLVKTLYSGISTGTELRMLKGSVSEAENMFPFVPGYSTCGCVEKTGPGVNIKIGKLVYLIGSDYFKEFNSGWGGHVGMVVAKADKAIILPDNIKPADATFIAVAGIACHGVLRCGNVKDKTVAIVGQGLIGQLAGQFFKKEEAKVIAIDLQDNRLETAKKLGADYVINSGKNNMLEEIRKIFPEGVDVAVDVTGHAPTIKETVKLLRAKTVLGQDPNPIFLLLGSYNGDIAFNYFDIYPKEPNVLISRNTNNREMELMSKMIANKEIRVEELVSKIFKPEQAVSAYKSLLEKPGEILSALFDWR
ncbi:MAG: hypothetical protein A2252_02290 [Elusimicrobia bacterium RIFOXYA2_FULL_39_19]|nr:MAG: hypothetical protein A2252_02290 [Elusimicrobia bacterium RIFOXYA2_FULL_39_19]